MLAPCFNLKKVGFSASQGGLGFLLTDLYSQTESAVKCVSWGGASSFLLNTGVRQGCVHAQSLFNTYGLGTEQSCGITEDLLTTPMSLILLF